MSASRRRVRYEKRNKQAKVLPNKSCAKYISNPSWSFYAYILLRSFFLPRYVSFGLLALSFARIFLVYVQICKYYAYDISLMFIRFFISKLEEAIHSRVLFLFRWYAYGSALKSFTFLLILPSPWSRCRHCSPLTAFNTIAS